MRDYLDLFTTFARISCFVLGGGFAIVPMVEQEFVRKRNQITPEEFADLLAIIQVSPGLMVANCATYVGNRLHGLRGALCAMAGAAIPPIIAICLIARVYQSIPTDHPLIQGAFVGIRAALCGLIFATAFRMRKTVLTSTFAQVLTAAAFLCLVIFKLNPALVILGCAALGIIRRYAHAD